jgi:hypothetical protein
MGRHTSLTPEVHAKIISAVRSGNYKYVAAQAAGVHRDSIHAWEQRAEKGEEPYASFADELREAEAQAEVSTIARVLAGGEGWTSYAWLAERRWARRWAQRVRQQVTEELDAGPILLQRSVPVLDDDTEDSLAARILAEEHVAYPAAVEMMIAGGWRIDGRRFRRL